MSEGSFASEDMFQSLLEKFPELLTDAEHGAQSPRRWILVKREAGISDRKDGGNRWSLDHLFLDQDGVPTLVEIKRATDTRARREVVAQMLDYAANSVRWWKVEDLVTWFEATCAKRNVDPSESISRLVQKEMFGPEDFWKTVQSNLLSGRIRLLFVADKIAPELERIVEFLNEQMSPATVLALELRPFSSGSDRILSPRLIGATARATAQKSVVSNLPDVSLEDWFSNLSSLEPAKSEPLRKFADLVAALGAELEVAGQSVAVSIKTLNSSARVAYLRSYGLVALSGWMLRKIPGLESEAARVSLLNEFEAAGFKLSNKYANGEPNIFLPEVDDEATWQKLRQQLSSLFGRIREAYKGPA